MTSNAKEQAERRQVLEDDRRWFAAQQPPMTGSEPPKGFTYHSRTVGEEAFPRGRYTEETKAPVVGAGARYPASSGPWSKSIDEVMGVEPPLGYEINQLDEIAGEPFEVRQAQQILDARMRAASFSGAHSADPTEPSVSNSLADVDRGSALPSQPRIRRRI